MTETSCENVPLDVGILRYNVSLQSFHQVFVISRPVKLFHLFLLDLRFVLQGRHDSWFCSLFSEGDPCDPFSFRLKLEWRARHSRRCKASMSANSCVLIWWWWRRCILAKMFTLSSFVLPAASFASLDSFFSLPLESLLLSPLAPRAPCLCWALTATLSRLLGGLLSL